MLRFFVFLCAICVLTPAAVCAQSTRARSAEQVTDSLEIAQLARSLTGAGNTDSARAARLYEWIARNLSYDVQGYLQGRLVDGTPETVFRKRTAVCGGYAALFERMAREVGLEAAPILGYAKGFTYRPGASSKQPNHAWLAVRVNGQWRLVDPTWGSGFVRSNKFEPHFSWDYFLVEADELILSHYPEDSRWQLLPRPLRRSEFERLPMIPRVLVNAGFDPAVIRATALKNGVRSFPLVGTRNDVRIITAPLSGTLTRKSKVSFDVSWPSGVEVALVSGGVWRKLTREGDRFHGDAIASESAVHLVGRSGGSKEYETLLQYQVQ